MLSLLLWLIASVATADYPPAQVACWWNSAGSMHRGFGPSVPAALSQPDGGGWASLYERRMRAVMESANPPTLVVVHAVGPKWPKCDPVKREFNGASRVFEFDWPLTCQGGRPVEGGHWHWPPTPYGDDFAEVMRGFREGRYSQGRPVELWVYTGKLDLWHLERLRKADPDAYRQRLIDTIGWFRDAGAAAVVVDALSEIPAGHESIEALQAAEHEHNVRIVCEAYPRRHFDTSWPGMPTLCLERGWRLVGADTGRLNDRVSLIPRRGVVVLGDFRARNTPTPSDFRQVLGRAMTPCVYAELWPELCGEFPPQSVLLASEVIDAR